MIALLLALAAPAAATAELAPLDFLVGHCWRGALANGDVDTHCFRRDGQAILDHHDVRHAGQPVYSGDTLYAWDATASAIRFTYTSVDGGVMKGEVRAAPDGLDFGETPFVGKNGAAIRIATHWVRLADGFERRSSSPDMPQMNGTVRYTRID